METINDQVSQPAVQPGSVVDYEAALRQYKKYGRGRSMKKFCEEEDHTLCEGRMTRNEAHAGKW